MTSLPFSWGVALNAELWMSSCHGFSVLKLHHNEKHRPLSKHPLACSHLRTPAVRLTGMSCFYSNQINATYCLMSTVCFFFFFCPLKISRHSIQMLMLSFLTCVGRFWVLWRHAQLLYLVCRIRFYCRQQLDEKLYRKPYVKAAECGLSTFKMFKATCILFVVLSRTAFYPRDNRFMVSLVCKVCTVSHKTTCIRYFVSVCVFESHYVGRLGQLVPLLNSQSHQITHCALRGANSSHKMLKHYLGGRKQLDSLESDASRQAATGRVRGRGGGLR